MTLAARTALLALALLAAGGVAGAHEYRVGDIEIAHPHSPAPPPGAPSIAGYLTLENEGDTADRLLGATVAFAGKVEMHTTTMDGDVARMRELADGIEIPPGAAVALVPNGTHLMFVDPEPGILVGDKLSATLHFERAGDVDVTFNVEDGATMQGEGMDHGMDHGAKPAN